MEITILVVVIAIVLIISALIIIGLGSTGASNAGSLFSKIVCPWC